MAYIGSTPPSRFVSNRAVTQFSGDGSEDEFTLEQVVAQDEDILVSVDGVIQEPTVAYEVSSGTTLTFDSAPSANAGNNIFVYYLASQVGTIGHPSTQGLTATTGAFSSNATVGGTIAVTGTSTLTGVTALGNTGSTVKSEGGAVTTNIAQGLAKAWFVYDQVNDALDDDLNITDVTDRQAGCMYGLFTTNMASINYTAVCTTSPVASGSMAVNNSNRSAVASADTTARSSMNTYETDNAGNFLDLQSQQQIIHGDLA